MIKTTGNDDYMARVVEYENMMRESADSEKSTVIQAAIDHDINTGLWDTEFRAFADAQTLKQLYYTELWVYLTVDLVAMKLSSQPMKVMTGEVVEGQFVKKPMESHPLQSLIENPNPFQGYSSWMYCLTVDLCTLGNSIMWYAPQSNYLMQLPGETVLLDINKEGTLAGYKVVEAAADGTPLVNKQTFFNVEDIVHMRRPNPSSILWGLSPFIPGRKSILFNRYSADYLNSFYQKGAMPGFALEMGGEANERVAMRLLRSFENAYTGRKNMRRTLVLPKGVSLKEVSHSLANQDLATYINMNREDIINILKVPKHELSLQSSGSLGSEETKASLKNFWYSTLIPMARIIEGELTRFFRRRGLLANDNTFLEFDFSNVEALQEDLETKALYAESLLKTHTLNEVRKIVYNLPDIEGGDVVQGYTNQPAAQPGGGFPSFLFSKPSEQIETMAAPLEDDQDEKDVVVSSSKASKDKLSQFLKGKDNWWDKREAAIRESAQKGAEELEKRILKMFADMAVTITKVVKSHLKEKSWNQIATKNNEERAKLVGKAELRRRLRRALDQYEEQYIDDTREVLNTRVDVGYNAAFELPFNIMSQDEIEGLRARNEAVRLERLENRSARIFAYLNETTLAGVYATIEQGIDQGKTVQEIASDLRNKFSNIAEIGSRAMTIARTETLTAVSIGQAAAMKDAAKEIPDLMKMWVSANDERVRASHEMLDGDIVKHDKPFANGLDFPRDPSGPPEEVINCRCSFIVVPRDQMKNIDETLETDEEIEL